ncbi:hypothetical protein SAMN05216276_10817 [Streptosporangium subroseum]|uniref:Uncharacterized protein n=1 Tax=Streptosporangium subroseum TaxID=106412 RepID=A0A239P1K6_9ACTN|nr:hypothetical protein [Streptosporangium subroseum]SNT60976.1 hypothetical protein SAMN05216276_10817 [Streptosporangium subroseum]
MVGACVTPIHVLPGGHDAPTPIRVLLGGHDAPTGEQMGAYDAIRR